MENKKKTPPDTPTPSLAATSSSLSDTSTQPPPTKKAMPFLGNIAPLKIQEHECISLSNEYGIEWESLADHDKKVLSFLFDRKVHDKLKDEFSEKATVRQKLLDAMNQETDAGERASVIVYERGQALRETVPDGVHRYDQFLSEYKHWEEPQAHHQRCNGERSYGCIYSVQQEFIDFINLLQDPYDLEEFQQVQLSGNCYLHAAILEYQYQRLFHGIQDETKKAVDIPRYMRHSYNAQDIYNHLFEGEGGRSENIFKKLAGKHVDRLTKLWNIRSVEYRNSSAMGLVAFMSMCGPVLFSGAILHNGFGEGGTHSYKAANCVFPEDPPPEEKDTRERHSMVLLGVQQTLEGGWMFLFQNSHRQSQFFEADYDWVLKSVGEFWTINLPQGTWKAPDIQDVFAGDGLHVYSESSPAVDRAGSGDETKSFTFDRSPEK